MVRKKLAAVLLGVIASAGLVAGLELGARILVPVDPVRIRDAVANIDQLASYLEPCAVSEGGTMLIKSHNHRFSRKKGRAMRIVVLGGSSAEQIGGDLRGVVDGVDPGAEVINCGKAGADISTVERRFEEVLEYKPDRVVVIFGHNIRFRLDAILWRLYLARVVVQSHAMVGLREQFMNDPPSFEWEPVPSHLRRYEAFLRHVGRESRARGFRALVTTMAVNVWTPCRRTRPESPQRLEARFLWFLGRRGAATAMLRSHVEANGSAEPCDSFLLGRWLFMNGQSEKARRYLTRASASHALIAPPPLNEMVRRVAREERFMLRDTEAFIARKAGPRLPGWNHFSDFCHLAHEKVLGEGRALFSMLRPDIALLSWDEDKIRVGSPRRLKWIFEHVKSDQEADVSQSLREAVRELIQHDSERVDHSMVALARDPTLMARFPPDEWEERKVGVVWGYIDAGEMDRAHALLQAYGMTGASAEVQQGLVALAEGRLQDASTRFQKAHALDPDRPDAPFFAARVKQELEAALP